MLKTASVAMAALMASVAGAKPPLQVVSGLVKVDRIRIASVRKIDGRVTMTSDWIPYAGFSDRAIPSGCLFDCFGRDWSRSSSGAPENNGACLADGSRWWFGSTAQNNHWLEDMTLHRNGLATELDFGFSWNSPIPTQCFVMFFLSTGGDLSVCDSTGGGSGNGVVLDFGLLGGVIESPYVNVDLSKVGGLWLDDTVTGYEGIIAEGFDGTNITLASVPCQPMLWGATENLRAESPACIMPGSFGNQGDNTFDDDTPNDGTFNAGECYTYNFGPGFCAIPLGKMVAFGGCATDVDGDGFSTGDDYDAFVVQFELGSPAGDYDGDGFVTGDDFDGFVEAFESGC